MIAHRPESPVGPANDLTEAAYRECFRLLNARRRAADADDAGRLFLALRELQEMRARFSSAPPPPAPEVGWCLPMHTRRETCIQVALFTAGSMLMGGLVVQFLASRAPADCDSAVPFVYHEGSCSRLLITKPVPCSKTCSAVRQP